MAGVVFGWLISLESTWTLYHLFLHLQVAITDENKMIKSTISTASLYLCSLSLSLSNKKCHFHSSRIPSEGLVVLLHNHYGIQPRTGYQANYRNLSGSAHHLEVGPKDYIEELHKQKKNL